MLLFSSRRMLVC